MEIKNAIIEKVSLGRIYNGIPSAYLELKYADGWCQSFGGYCLGGEAMSIFILGVLDVVDCEKWEDLPGKPIRVKMGEDKDITPLSPLEYSKIEEIGNFLNDKWFNPKKTFAEKMPNPKYLKDVERAQGTNFIPD